MQRLNCYLIMGVYCLFAFFFIPVTFYTVAGLLGAIIILCLSYYFNHTAITGALAMCYAVSGLFFPEIYLFFPMIAGELGRMNSYFPMILAVLGLAIHLPIFDFFRLASHLPGTAHNIFTWETDITLENICYVMLGCALALLLNRMYTEMSELKIHFNKTRDDNAELHFLLQDRNRLLLEKQDYEIHTAMLQERNRIAREIHDNAGHMLSRCILLTGMIKTMNSDEECGESLELLEGELTKTMDSMRNSVHDLHKDAMNLQEKLQELLTQFVFCPTSFDYDAGPDIPSNIKYAFLAITKEALTNVSRHSNATNVQIRITEHPSIYQLVISDNGTNHAGKTYRDGMGLQNIKERVSALSGTLQIIRENGFRIFVSVPKASLDKKYNRIEVTG